MVAEVGALVGLTIGDDPRSWQSAGFAVANNRVMIASLVVHLVGTGRPRGALGWELTGIASDIDGIASLPVDGDLAVDEVHPNGVVGVDHIVVRSGDIERTTSVLGSYGIHQRKVRSVEIGGTAHEQRFFWVGPTIMELIGPVPPTDAPTKVWGLALTSADIDATSEALGDRATTPKPAVQPGRRICTLDTRSLDISVPIAVMDPHRP